MIAKARLDALTDGIFAVAMTLLVLDLRFPPDLHLGTGQELIGALREVLWGPFVAYAISFFVIGLRWRTISRLGGTRAHVGKTYVRWSLVHLFFITCMPFSTMVMGRHIDLAPAVWLYAANTALAAGAAWWLVCASEAEEDTGQTAEANVRMPGLIGIAVLSVGVSLVSPRLAMGAYVLCFLGPAGSRGRGMSVAGCPGDARNRARGPPCASGKLSSSCAGPAAARAPARRSPAARSAPTRARPRRAPNARAPVL